MRLSTERLLIGAVLAVSLLALGLQAFVLRPRLWPAGAGLALSGDTVMGTLAAPRPVAVIRPPDIDQTAGTSVTVVRVWPGGAADRAGIIAGDRVRGLTRLVLSGVEGPANRIALDNGFPPDPAEVLRVWRDVQRMTPGEQLRLEITSAGPSTSLWASGATREVTLDPPAIWAIDDAPWGPWARQHLGPLSQIIGFLAGAGALLALGAHGTTATLMTLALIATPPRTAARCSARMRLFPSSVRCC